jgi:hypothetical protein
MAAPRRQFDVFVLRYVPSVLEDRYLDIGVLMKDRDDAGFADARFLHDWQKVRSFDPDADLKMLDSLTREIEDGWKNPAERPLLLRRMVKSFSNAIQWSLTESIETDDPAQELERLASTLR